MKYLITLLFAGLLFTLQAQEKGTTVTISLDNASCEEGDHYQINMQVCEPKDRAANFNGVQESERDWSKFNGIDNNYTCKETLKQKGCEAVFYLDGHALDQVYSVSIVKVNKGSMEMMQVLVPVQQAGNETTINIKDLTFQPRSLNLKNELEVLQTAQPASGSITLSPKKDAY